MKIKTTLAAAALAAFAAVAAPAFAAEESAIAANPPATDAAKSTQSVQQASAPKKVKPHSHVQEKTGVTPSVSPARTPEEKAGMDKMHQHQRDAK